MSPVGEGWGQRREQGEREKDRETKLLIYPFELKE
jgi:hypothetical protein